MTEEDIKLDARLFALEYMTAHAVSRLYLMMKATDEQLDQVEADSRATLSETVIPGINPAMSDHYAGELQEAIVRLQTITRDMFNLTKTKL